MHVTTGPARYFFLRRPPGAKEDVPNWPPAIKPLQQPDNWICAAVYLTAEEVGWRAQPVRDEAGMAGDASGALLLTRETALGLVQDNRRAATVLNLLGVRVVQGASDPAEYASHMLVRVAGGLGLGMPKHTLVVPITALVLSAYLEHADTAEAQLDLRLAPSELASMPPYLPDPAIEQAASRALDAAILSPRQRHEIKPEVEAGRVTLYGRAELTTVGDLARAELEHTPGVIEILDRVLYDEDLMEQVREALAPKGYTEIGVRSEHGLIELDGVVPDMATVHKMKDAALRVTGVRGVVTNQVRLLAPLVAANGVTDAGHAAGDGPARVPGTNAALGAQDTAGANTAPGKPPISSARRG